MHTSKIWVLAASVCLVTFSSVHAAEDVSDKYFDFMISGEKADRDRLVDDGLNGATARLGKAFNERWNLEFAASGLKMSGDKSKGGKDINQFAVGGNALAVFNRGGQFQPYILTGIGAAQSRYQSAPNDTNLYYDLGIGAIVPLFDGAGRLRGEVLRRADNDMFDSKDWILNIGFGTFFGAKAAAPRAAPIVAAPVDSDGDGVPDTADRCPGTPAGAAVDANGCELDSDGDGVVDRLDECPGTPRGTAVDAVGCPLVTVINLEGVNFQTNSANLSGGADEVLNEQAATLVANEKVTIEVAGHTDSDGEASYNQGLSQRRAETVRDYLIAKGVAADRIIARGYGESEPIADNAYKAGKAANRRVELRIRNK